MFTINVFTINVRNTIYRCKGTQVEMKKGPDQYKESCPKCCTCYSCLNLSVFSAQSIYILLNSNKTKMELSLFCCVGSCGSSDKKKCNFRPTD